MPPHVFHGVNLWGIGRQSLDFNPSLGAGNIIADHGTAMNGGPIPENQQLARNMALEVFEKFHYLQAFDAAGVKLEIKLPQNHAANERKAFPIESFLQERGLAARRPGPCPGRLSA